MLWHFNDFKTQKDEKIHCLVRKMLWIKGNLAFCHFYYSNHVVIAQIYVYQLLGTALNADDPLVEQQLVRNK